MSKFDKDKLLYIITMISTPIILFGTPFVLGVDWVNKNGPLTIGIIFIEMILIVVINYIIDYFINRR